MTPFTTILASSSLASHLADPQWVVLDCRFTLDDPSAGEREYAESHIPGAVYVHLDRDLSGTKTGQNGRHPLPSIEEMAQRFGALGIDAESQVVAYDQGPGAYASRLWWMLRYLGHDAVAVLDGGFARWAGERRPVRAGLESRDARTLTPRVRREMLVTVDELARRLHEPELRLVDARSSERYRGEVEPIDRVPGHIPGAVNHHYQRNLGPDGGFLGATELRAQLAGVLADTPPGHVITYCGSGVTACHNLLAMEIAGLPGARLYAGSWSEWSADPGRPVEQGGGEERRG
jgi:thiosulfate/3-mercaptopyruvate sulfurtransferase